MLPRLRRCLTEPAGCPRDLQDSSAKDPQDLELRRDVAGVEQSLAKVLAESGRKVEAVRIGRQALEILELQRGDPTDRENAQKVEELRAQIANLGGGR